MTKKLKLETEAKVAAVKDRDRHGKQKYDYGAIVVKSKKLAPHVGKKARVKIEVDEK